MLNVASTFNCVLDGPWHKKMNKFYDLDLFPSSQVKWNRRKKEEPFIPPNLILTKVSRGMLAIGVDGCKKRFIDERNLCGKKYI